MALETVQRSENCLLIKIRGRFDFSCHTAFREAYAKAPSNCDFVIDMEETSYMDSSALGMLLLLREHVSQNGGRISITNCRGQTLDVLRIANFNRLFKIQS